MTTDPTLAEWLDEAEGDRGSLVFISDGSRPSKRMARVLHRHDQALAMLRAVEGVRYEYEGYGHGEFNIHPDPEAAVSCGACQMIHALRAAMAGAAESEGQG